MAFRYLRFAISNKQLTNENHSKELAEDRHTEAVNQEGDKIRMDGNTTIGGLEGGAQPDAVTFWLIPADAALSILLISWKNSANRSKT